MDDITILKKIHKKAAQSICKMRVAALGFNRENICVIARTNHPRFSRKGGGAHAEARVMQKAKKLGITHIVICRIGTGSDFRPIDPCPACQAIAKKLNITISTIKEDTNKIIKKYKND